MPRNKLAGKFTGKSKSSKYFANNPEARAKKNAYNKAYHSTPERRKYRGELVQERRDRGIYGKGGKDVSHTKSGKTVLESRKINRARNGKAKGKSSLK
jgi:hypothetical protein